MCMRADIGGGGDDVWLHIENLQTTNWLHNQDFSNGPKQSQPKH